LPSGRCSIASIAIRSLFNRFNRYPVVAGLLAVDGVAWFGSGLRMVCGWCADGVWLSCVEVITAGLGGSLIHLCGNFPSRIQIGLVALDIRIRTTSFGRRMMKKDDEEGW